MSDALLSAQPCMPVLHAPGSLLLLAWWMTYAPQPVFAALLACLLECLSVGPMASASIQLVESYCEPGGLCNCSSCLITAF